MPIVGVEDPAHRVAYVNPAFCLLVAKEKEELLGTRFENIPIVGEQCSLILERVYRTGQAETVSVNQRSGPYPLCSYAMWPILSSGKSSPGIILQVIEKTSIHQDAIAMNEALMLGLIRQHELTETADTLNRQLRDEMLARKNAEQALILSEKLASVGRMAAVVAHEINNPLSAVMDVLYLAERTEGIPEVVREYLVTADAELKRIAHITRQTLGFYREKAALVTFPVVSLLESVLDLLRNKIESRKGVVKVECERDLSITAVHGELRQIVSNLLANSLDALDKNGKVVIRASTLRDPLEDAMRIRVTISDNGKGIEPVASSRIFDPFFTTKDMTGNGLGLWVTKQLVEKHGGRIRFRTQTSGKHCGTTFSVWLPTGQT